MRVVELAAVQLGPVLIAEGTVEKVAAEDHELGHRGCSSPRSRRPWCLTTVHLVHRPRAPRVARTSLPYTMLEGASYGKTR